MKNFNIFHLLSVERSNSQISNHFESNLVSRESVFNSEASTKKEEISSVFSPKDHSYDDLQILEEKLALKAFLFPVTKASGTEPVQKEADSDAEPRKVDGRHTVTPRFKLNDLCNKSLRYEVIYKNLLRDMRKFYLQEFNASTEFQVRKKKEHTQFYSKSVKAYLADMRVFS